AAIHGLGLDLDQDPFVDEIHPDDRRCRADVAEDLAVDDRDTVYVVYIADVDAGHDHFSERGAEVFERALHDLDRAPHLVDHIVRYDLAVLVEAGGAGDADHAPVPDRARISELELVLR